MTPKIALNGVELCAALGVDRFTIADLEEMPNDPLPFFELPGRYEHLYAVKAVSDWAARQCEKSTK